MSQQEANKVQLRQLSLNHHGNGQEYELFKKNMEASPILYQHDLHFFNDDITTRHYRNIAELKYLQTLIKDNKINTGMLKYNVYNTFYPSYVLNHHYSFYLPILLKLNRNKEIKTLLQQTNRRQLIGAFLHQTRKINFNHNHKQYPLLDQQGVITMDENTFFYSASSSPYISHAAFLAKHNNQLVLTVVAVRNKEGDIASAIEVRDFGGTVSNDYLSIGYRFSGVKPLLTVALQQPQLKMIKTLPKLQQFSQFGYSLKDLQKSLWITIKYTSMRKQFKTIDNSKEERAIITYQAVADRIISALAQFEALSDLYTKVMTYQNGQALFADLLFSSHHVILQQLIHLRECCGGFGFMQLSGHPGCLERVCYRAGNEPQEHLNLTRSYLKATQYYSGSQQLQKYYIQEVTDPSMPYMHFFSIFLSICRNMRNAQSQMTPHQFRRQFLKQTSIVIMHGRQQFLRYDSSNPHCQLLQYLLLNYIIKNAKYIEWTLIKIDQQIFFDQLYLKKITAFENVLTQINELCELLELKYLRNTIVGRSNQKEFYQELMEASQNNLRNSTEFRNYVRAPIIEMIVQNRAKL